MRDAFRALGLEAVRNPWDRLGHFMQGFVPALLARELLLRCTPLRPGAWLTYLCIAAALSFSAFFEMLEWWAALVYGADADAFLATQGDVWDTQWDMFLCLCGACVSLLLWSRLHDRQLGGRGLDGHSSVPETERRRFTKRQLIPTRSSPYGLAFCTQIHALPAPTKRTARPLALMHEFAERTGLIGDAPPQRYLWTDAFAVCNFLALGEIELRRTPRRTSARASSAGIAPTTRAPAGSAAWTRRPAPNIPRAAACASASRCRSARRTRSSIRNSNGSATASTSIT